MSEIKFCVNCKKYSQSEYGFGFSIPAMCMHSVELSPVTGEPMRFVPSQGCAGGPSMLEVRRDMCKGDWYEEKPVDIEAREVDPDEPRPGQIIWIPTHEKAKPWWRFW